MHNLKVRKIYFPRKLPLPVQKYNVPFLRLLFSPIYRVLDYVNCLSFLLSVTPTITDMPDTVAVPEGSDARLPCFSVGNPSTHLTNWTRHGESLASHPRFAVLEKGSLLIQNVRRTDAGEYVCTPYNKVGGGVSKTTTLVLKGKNNL